MVAQNIDRNTKLQNCQCCQSSCSCRDCPKCTKPQADIIPAPKPSERRHDIQYIRCKCGLNFSSYRDWIEHFKYRYILLNSEKMPINPKTGVDQNKIDINYLGQELMNEIIAEHSGEHSSDV